MLWLMRTLERVSISAFVDPDDERLVERARAEDRSLSAEVRVAIREHLSLPSGATWRASSSGWNPPLPDTRDVR
jgi:hypothetical protein